MFIGYGYTAFYIFKSFSVRIDFTHHNLTLILMSSLKSVPALEEITADHNNIFLLFGFHEHNKFHLSNILKKRDIDPQVFKIVDPIMQNLNNFHSLEVVNRVSETQLRVSENSNSITGGLMLVHRAG